MIFPSSAKNCRLAVSLGVFLEKVAAAIDGMNHRNIVFAAKVAHASPPSPIRSLYFEPNISGCLIMKVI
jgi:hypothetical protein